MCLPPGVSLKPKKIGGLKRTLARAGMFRAESKDHEGILCKGHDRTASKMPERGGYEEPCGCGVEGGCSRHSLAAFLPTVKKT